MVELQKQHSGHPVPEPQPPSPAPVYKKSAGDKLFDLSVYGGLGFIANATISLAIERYAVQLPGTTLHKMGVASERQFAKLMGTLTKNPKAIDYWAKKSNQILFLSSGGWAMVVPMQWLENNKSDIIHSLDRTLGTGPKTPEQCQLQDDALDNGPRIGLISMLGGRIVSYSATIAVALPFVTKWTRTSDRLAMFLDKQLGQSIGELRHPTILIGENKVPAFLNSCAVEAIMAATAAGLHYVTSKGLAKVGHTIAGSLPTELTAALPETQVFNAQHDQSLAPESISNTQVR